MKTVSAGRQDDDMEEREKKDDTIWYIFGFCRILIGVSVFSAIMLQSFPPLMCRHNHLLLKPDQKHKGNEPSYIPSTEEDSALRPYCHLLI